MSRNKMTVRQPEQAELAAHRALLDLLEAPFRDDPAGITSGLGTTQLLRIYCGPCRKLIAHVSAAEPVWYHSAPRPRDLPVSYLQVRLPASARDDHRDVEQLTFVLTGWNNPRVLARAASLGLSGPPATAATWCAVHGVIPLKSQDAINRARKHWNEVCDRSDELVQQGDWVPGEQVDTDWPRSKSWSLFPQR